MICCWAQDLAEAVILHRLGPHDGSRQEADGAITHRPSPPPHRLTPVPPVSAERGCRAAPPTGRHQGPADERTGRGGSSRLAAPSFVGHVF